MQGSSRERFIPLILANASQLQIDMLLSALTGAQAMASSRKTVIVRMASNFTQAGLAFQIKRVDKYCLGIKNEEKRYSLVACLRDDFSQSEHSITLNLYLCIPSDIMNDSFSKTFYKRFSPKKVVNKSHKVRDLRPSPSALSCKNCLHYYMSADSNGLTYHECRFQQKNIPSCSVSSMKCYNWSLSR